MAAPENDASAKPLDVQQQRQYGMIVPFQKPASFAPTPSNKGHFPQWSSAPFQQQQPQFVVFELFGPQSSQNNPSQLVPTRSSYGSPFLPIRQQPTSNAWRDQQPQSADNSGRRQWLLTGARFTTMQLNNNNPLGKAASRLLFDNPMFRRLPNWHFFGDDRRFARIPPMIPLIPVPVERTLLYIAPSVSSTRQLLLFTMLDLKRRGMLMPSEETETANEQFGAEFALYRSNSSEPEELLSPEQCPSTSGVESMSSEETANSLRSSPTTTPMRTPTPVKIKEVDADDVECENDTRFHWEGEISHLQKTTAINSSATAASSSSADSVASSAPNSPPTFDRRIVRMSRRGRDERRLSRRFCEGGEDDEDDEEQIRNCTEDDDGTQLTAHPHISMTSTLGQQNGGSVFRNRHASADSNNTNKRSNQQQQKQQHKKLSVNEDSISRMDVLSERILNFHQNMEQSQMQLNRKLHLRDQLYYAISPIFPMCGLYIVGSSLNGFGTSSSDLDLCLMITNRDIDQRSDAVVVLSSVERTLATNSLVAEHQLILAKVPILRIRFNGGFSDIMVDLNVNNSVAIRNTHLMCYYSSFDWRVRPLVMVVKEWAKRHGINNANRSSFTSYSLVLMVIHYLQFGAKHPILPSLQKHYTKRFSDHADVRTLNVSLPLDPIPNTFWQFNDELSLSELLLGFLGYYAFHFDFNTDAISIRQGKKVNRAQVAQNQSPFNTLSQWHCICIEEPFTLSNAAHSIYDERIFQEIKKTFVDSYQELDKHRDLDRFLGSPTENNVDRAVKMNNEVAAVGSECVEPKEVAVTEHEQPNASSGEIQSQSPH